MKHKLESNKKKSWQKILSISAITAAIAGGLTGIGFGVTNFVKYGSNNKGSGYGDSLQIQLQFALNNPTTGQYSEQDYANEAANVGKKITLLSDLLGFDGLQIQSGIEKNLDSSSNTLNVGNVTLHTNTKFLYYDFSQNTSNTDLTPEQIQANNDENKLSLYYQLTQNNNYYLENISAFTDKNNTSDSTNFENLYHLNNTDSSDPNNITKAYKSKNKGNQLLFDLRAPSNNQENNDWDLSKFQNQFTSVYSWDGSNSETRQDVINNAQTDPNSSINLTTPQQSYILFTNRSGLISLLQNLTTIAYLEQMSNKGLDTNQLKRVQALYDKIAENSEYKSFMEWVASANGYDWYSIMSQLYTAQNKNFGIDWTKNKDPLLELLSAYYSSGIYATNHPNRKKFKNYEFLYSWNFEGFKQGENSYENDNFLSPYLEPIDYYNWFNYFEQNATKDELNDKDYVTSNYFSKTINTNFKIYDYSVSNIDAEIKLLNDASIDNEFINYYLLPLINYNAWQNVENLYNQYFNNFLNNFVFILPAQNIESVTKLSPFNGAMIGLSCLILIIGIIISVLYRIPGLMISFASFVAYGLSLLMMTSLNITFTVSSVFSLLIGIFSMFAPFIYAYNTFKCNFRKSKLSLNNAFKNSLSVFIKSSFFIYINLIIIGLVYLFFGTHQIKNFGVTLTLIIFSNIIFCLFLMLIIWPISHYLYLDKNSKLMFNKKDILIAYQLRSDFANLNNDEIVQNTKLDIISNKISRAIVDHRWIVYLALSVVTIIGIIGVILIKILGPGNSIYFSYSQQISINFLNTDPNNINVANSIADAIKSQLNINWFSKIVYNNVIDGNYDQLLLVPNKLVDVNQIYPIIQNIAPTWVPNVKIMSTSPYLSNLLTNNSLHCILISIGLMAILNMFMLNIVNVIPLVFISLLQLLIAIGIIGITRIRLNLNSLTASGVLFIFNQIILMMTFMDLKWNFDTKKRTTRKDLLNYSFNQITSTINMMALALLLFVISLAIMSILDSANNLINYLMLFINSVIIWTLTLSISPLLFTGFMLIRELYISKVIVNIGKKSKYQLYDKVDEQIIVGINHN